MKHFLADHSGNAFLKPGEVVISANPILVSTVLGSCVAVTMYSPEKRIGAICHAMLPQTVNRDDNLFYVDTAIRYIHRKMRAYGETADLIIKLFGGAQVLTSGHSNSSKRSVGQQNILQTTKTLEQLGLLIASADIGGTLGRKLFFSIKTGDVYVRKLNGLTGACLQQGGAA